MKRRMRRNADTVTLEVETKVRPVSVQRVSLTIAGPDSRADRIVQCFDVDSCYEVLDVESKKAKEDTYFAMSVWRDGRWIPMRQWVIVDGKLEYGGRVNRGKF